MAIQKYAKSYFYGYGFIVMEYSYSPIRIGFAKEVTIKYREGEEKEIRFETNMRPITLKQKDYSGNFTDIKQPIYLVEDNGVWKEYFSGVKVQYIKEFDSILFSNFRPINEYMLSGGIYYVGNKTKGIRQLAFGLSKWEQEHLMEAQDFADEISRYSDVEIKNMVGQFLRLKENAVTWGAKFDKAVEGLANSYNLKNEMASNKLADGMGKYANVEPGFSKEIILDQKSNQSTNMHINEKKESNNGLLIVLFIVLIVIAIWIFR